MAGRSDKGSALLKGAAVLGGAAILSKLIGTMQKIPLQNMAGDAVFGIYNAVYPLYTLILFLATAGFPLVVSKFVAERAAVHDHAEARRVLRVSIAILMATGIACFALLYGGAGWLARLIGAAHTEGAIRSVSFALLLVPAMSALRGYYQGYQQMAPTAVSQLIEQTVRVATMFGLLMLFMHWQYGPEWIAAGATFGSVTGAAAGLAVMLWFWRRRPVGGRHSEHRSDGPQRPPGAGSADREQARAAALRAAGDDAVDSPPGRVRESAGQLARRLAAYALPVCLGQIAMPILTIVDSFTLPRLLARQSGSETEGLYQFGLYNHGLPLVQLVIMIASSMSAAIVPALADAQQTGSRETVRRRTEVAIRVTWFVGLAASCGLAALAAPMNVMFYKTTEGTAAMAIVAFTAMLGALNVVAGSVLQGCGFVVAPALYMIAAAALKAAGNAWLVPRYGIDGAAAAAVAAYAVAGGLTLAHAMRAAGVAFAMHRYVYRPLAAVLAMCIALWLGQQAAGLLFQPGSAAPSRGAATVVALAGSALGAAVYAMALLRAGAIDEGELRLIPKLKDNHIAKLKKLRLIP